MSGPVSPNDIDGLLRAYDRGFAFGVAEAETEEEQVRSGRRFGAIAVAHAVCPHDCVVVRREDLLNALENWDDAGHSVPNLFTAGGERAWWGDFEQSIYDRLRATIDWFDEQGEDRHDDQ